MSDDANFEDGHQASVEIQSLIISLLEQGMDPRSIALMSYSIGASMIIEHYGKTDGGDICAQLTRRAIEGDLPTFPALKAANQNIKD